jgi:hypothetical protein
MMKQIIPVAVVMAAATAVAAPAFAQNDRALIVYGNDPCPEGTVCVRAPETERYRIPQSLRNAPLAPKDQPWARKAESVSSAGNVGTGSCTNVGAGSWTGCWQRDMRAAREENHENAEAVAASPLPK